MDEIEEFICGGPKFYGCFDKNGNRIVAKAKGNRIPDDPNIRDSYLQAVYGQRTTVPHFSKRIKQLQPMFQEGVKVFGSRFDVKRKWLSFTESVPHGC